MRFNVLLVVVLIGAASGCGSTSRTPPPACSLTAAQLDARLAEIDAVLDAHCVDIADIDDGYALTLEGGDAAREAISDIAAKEAECCPFLTWDIAPTRDDVVHVTVTGDKALLTRMLKRDRGS